MYRLLRELQLTLSQCFKMCTPVFTVLETESPDSNRTPGCQVDDTGRTRAQDEPCATLCFVSGNPGNSENNESHRPEQKQMFLLRSEHFKGEQT